MEAARAKLYAAFDFRLAERIPRDDPLAHRRAAEQALRVADEGADGKVKGA